MTVILPLPPERQYLLSPERQLTLCGAEEPLVGMVSVEAPSPAPDTRTGSLFAVRPLPLPLPTRHAPVDGRVARECNDGRGFHASTCPNHPEKPKVHPHVCGVQNCLSSREANTKERARDAWNGTADKGERVGLRHLSVPWGIFVFTLPSELRGLCVGKKVPKFRRAAQDMAVEVMRRNGAGPDAEFYGRSWLHPVGDAEIPAAGECETAEEDGITYKPHENVLMPLAFLRGGRVHRLRTHLPKSWLGEDGWVQEAWREKLVGVFGQWWPTGTPPPVTNWFYEYRETVEQKKHALRYFARVFPGWGGHKKVSCRPRAWGLAHWKKKAALLELVQHLEEDREYATCPKSTFSDPCPPALSVSADTEERVVQVLQALVAERQCADGYVQTRRTMGGAAPLSQSLDPPRWALAWPSTPALA